MKFRVKETACNNSITRYYPQYKTCLGYWRYITRHSCMREYFGMGTNVYEVYIKPYRSSKKDASIFIQQFKDKLKLIRVKIEKPYIIETKFHVR